MVVEPESNAEASPSARPRRDRLPVLAFAFVVLTLILLAVIPALLLHRMASLSGEITSTVLPAYQRLRDLSFAMEERISSSRSVLLTGDPRYEARLADAREAEQQALREYEELAPNVSAASAEHLRSLLRHMVRRDSLEAGATTADNQIEAFRTSLAEFDIARDSMLLHLVGLQQDLMRQTQARTAEVSRLVSLQQLLSLLLGTAALAATAVVGWSTIQQRRLQRELRVALAEAHREHRLAQQRGEELEEAMKARVRLLRGITHDVKNPLGAAKGYASLLEAEVKGPLRDDQRPFVEGIQRSVDGALAIITDLLDLARADSSGLDVHRVRTELQALVGEATADYQSSAESAGHTLQAELSPEPIHLFTDPIRVKQILGNLLSNAVKYTPPPGRISVSGAIEEDEAGALWAAVRVRDSGPGIPPDQRETIFDEFTRLEDDRSQSGHGLGLAIARRIARILDGDLTAEGAEGGGAVFVLRLPLRRDDSHADTNGG